MLMDVSAYQEIKDSLRRLYPPPNRTFRWCTQRIPIEGSN